MPTHAIEIAIHLCTAWLAGGLIGLERSHHGRPAGFRTHALVCVASALLMQLTTYQWLWIGTAPADTLRTDPTRMAQGIMTGIGFLGAGVIFKEGLTVRGLTTAASIWMTAALGILFGIAFYYPALLASAITLLTLSVFRWIENRMPTESHAHCQLRFDAQQIPSERELRSFMRGLRCSISGLSYRLVDSGRAFEYRMVLKTARRDELGQLAEELRRRGDVLEFRISPSGE
jgi:putative Mg2+ transporter-C (MgtC) family protein